MSGKANNLKSIRRALRQLEAEVINIQEDIEENQLLIDDKLEMIKTLKERKELLEKGEIIISDHAMIRYIERVIGIPQSDIKSKIVSDSFKRLYIGDGKYKLDGVQYVIKDNVIVTII